MKETKVYTSLYIVSIFLFFFFLTAKICLFQNGLKIGRTSQVGPTWKTSCADYTHTGIQNANVSIRLNHPTGCKGVVVDEVAMWTKALNMSELIALRVEPFMDLGKISFYYTLIFQPSISSYIFLDD